MTTQLDRGFLSAIILTTSFRGDDMARAQAALLLIGLAQKEFTAGHLPKEICGDSKSLAGCATGALLTAGLIVPIGRVRSPNPDANGRKCNLLTVPDDKKPLARLWLARHGYQDHVEIQTEIAV